MRAIVCDRYGPPEVLRMEQVATPEPGPGQVRVAVELSTVSAADSRVRAFRVPPSYWLPARLALGLRRPRQRVLGSELAGVVDRVGLGTTTYAVGDRLVVAVRHQGGAYAEYRVLTSEDLVALMPPGLDMASAVAVPFGGLTAQYFLRAAEVQEGQDVLIHGAAGAVGVFAVQLARLRGARVTAVCGASHVDVVARLGAHRVVDRTQLDITTEDQGSYDVVLDVVGKASRLRLMRLVRRGGVYAYVAGPLGPRMAWTARRGGFRLVGGAVQALTSDLEVLVGDVAEGRLRVVIDRSYPWTDVVSAHRYVDEGHKSGVVVLEVRGDDGSAGAVADLD